MSRTPRICIATSRYFRSGETFVNRHVAELFGGDSVVLCGRRTGADPHNKAVFSRFDAALNPMDVVTAPLHLWRNSREHAAPFVPFGHGRRALVDFLRQQRVDVILAEFGSQAVSLWPVARDLDLPIFSYFRGRDASKYLENPRRIEGYRQMFKHLAGIFAVSQFLLDNLTRHGLTHPRAHVVPSGVDTRQFRPGPKQPGRMLVVGRFVEKKAPDITLDAFLACAREHPDAQLEFVGDGPLLRSCRARASASPHAARVTFHGARPHAFVRERLQGADIFVQHSVTGRDGETEGMPTAIQEAMSCGAAVLSTRHAGIPDIVEEGRSGLLTEEHDLPAFANAMNLLLADPEATRRMGEAARRVAETRLDYRILYATVERVITETWEAWPERSTA